MKPNKDHKENHVNIPPKKKTNKTNKYQNMKNYPETKNRYKQLEKINTEDSPTYKANKPNVFHPGSHTHTMELLWDKTQLESTPHPPCNIESFYYLFTRNPP